MSRNKTYIVTNEIAQSDFVEVAKLHKKLIPEGNLSSFPMKLLITIYKSIAKSKYSFIYVAKNEKQLIGFIAGSIDTKKVLRSFVVANFYRIDLFVLLLLHSIKNKRINQNKETLIYMQKNKITNLSKSEILNFCVDYDFQGKGVSKFLFNALNQAFSEKGITVYKIDTGFDQISAQKFYEKNGAKKEFTYELHKGIKSIIYTMKI